MMKTKSLVVLATSLLLASTSSATSQCPFEAKDRCGPNPFYVLIVSLVDTCTRVYPEQAQNYKIRLEEFIAENPYDYARLHSDKQFSQDLNALKRTLQSMKAEELHEECGKLRTAPFK